MCMARACLLLLVVTGALIVLRARGIEPLCVAVYSCPQAGHLVAESGATVRLYLDPFYQLFSLPLSYPLSPKVHCKLSVSYNIFQIKAGNLRTRCSSFASTCSTTRSAARCTSRAEASSLPATRSAPAARRAGTAASGTRDRRSCGTRTPGWVSSYFLYV